MKRENRKPRLGGSNMLSVMPLVVVMALSVPLATTVGFLILLKTGPWAVPLFLCYLALLMVPGNYAATLRENNNLRFIKGDEIYYTEHPQALHKALRLARKKGVAPEKRAFVQQIQQEPLPVFPENPADAKRIRRAQGRFLLSGLLLLALGAFLLWRGWALYEPNRLSGRRQFSYSFLFPLLGALPVIATGLLACIKRRVRILFPVTLLILLLGAWGSGIAPSVGSRLNGIELLISFGCAALYAFLCFVCLPREDEAKSRETLYRAYRDLQCKLYEVGCFDGDMLQIHLEKQQKQLGLAVSFENEVRQKEMDF